MSKTRLFQQPSGACSSYPNQKRTMEMRDKVLSSAGAQDMYTCGYQVSDLNDVEFYWENDQLDVDALFRTGKGTPLSPSSFNDFEVDSNGENTNLIDQQQDKENSPPLPTTAVSERPT